MVNMLLYMVNMLHLTSAASSQALAVMLGRVNHAVDTLLLVY